MFTTNEFKELLVETSNFDDLPEQWVRHRAKLVPYVARAYRFAITQIKEGNKERSKTCDFKEYSDCRLSALLYREGQEAGPVAKVSVAFEPVRKSLGQFSFDYDLKEQRIAMRFFLTENTFIKMEAVAVDFGATSIEYCKNWLHLKSFSLVNKLSGDEKNYYPALVFAKSFIS